MDAKFVLVSFNNDGFITPDEMKTTLSSMGKLDVLEKKHNTFRGGRNPSNRPLYVTEILFLLEKQ